MEVGCGRREWKEASPLPERAGRESVWGDTARCGCCNIRSSAAPPRRAATLQSWRWCCPPCCGRFQRPPSASCTPRGQLALLLPEHLQRAKRRGGDEKGFAPVTNRCSHLYWKRKTPHGSQTHSFFFSHPSSSFLGESCTVWKSPQEKDASHCSGCPRQQMTLL